MGNTSSFYFNGNPPAEQQNHTEQSSRILETNQRFCFLFFIGLDVCTFIIINVSPDVNGFF